MKNTRRTKKKKHSMRILVYESYKICHNFFWITKSVFFFGQCYRNLWAERG